MEEKAIPSTQVLTGAGKAMCGAMTPALLPTASVLLTSRSTRSLNKNKGRSLFTFSLQRPRIDEGAHREPQRRRQRVLPVAHREPAPVLAYRRALRGADGDRQRPRLARPQRQRSG